MKVFFRSIVFLVIIGSVTGCIEEVPNEAKFEQQVFVSGFLVNTTDSVRVYIVRTTPVSDLSRDPVNDAKISLYTKDPEGNVSLLTDNFLVNKGKYTTSEKITCLVGNHYWIEVELPDDTKLMSAVELMKPSIPITDIVKTEGFTRIVFKDPPEERNFYLMHFILYKNAEPVADIFKLSADVLYNGNENAFVEIDNTYGNWVFGSIQNLNFTTYQYYLNSFSQYEKNIDYQIEGGDPGLLFQSPPAELLGNITNITTNKTALGFFGVFSYDYGYKQFE
ncbi:MAG: DUF4249 family protein [Cyclobacteriaceae bacterium]